MVTYWPHTLDVGSGTAPWTYTTNGELYAVPGYITSTEYEADGQTSKITYANEVVTDFTYSPTRRWLTRLVTTRPNGVKLIDNSYTRDLAGRITAITGLTLAERWTYDYNNLDWLMSVDNLGNNALDETFSYSTTGN